MKKLNIINLDYSCANENNIAGYLYITPNYLVFDTTIHFFGETKKIIPIRDIISLDKVKLGFLPGKGSDLKINVLGNQVYIFKRFLSRKEAVGDILKQASNLNHHIQELRDGVVDTTPNK